MTKRTLTLTGLAMVTIATPAMAKPASVDEVARCALNKDRDASVAAMRALPLGTQAVTLDPGRLGGAAACAREPVSAPAVVVRGAFAEALYRADFKEVGVTPRRTRDYADLGLPDTGKNAPKGENIALYRLADCVARNDAGNVDALIRSKEGSNPEKMIFARLQPYLGACGGAGEKWAYSRPALRGALAQAAYRTSARYWSGDLTASARR